jgi:beta-phosphoglucomutase-like phosphatase (HAD superfamily)
MQLKALIFDVDGTLADTEEAHRCAFNEAFVRQGLPWKWSKPRYAELLRTTGGKERIGMYIAQLPLSAEERLELLRRVPDIHAAKTQSYATMASAGAVRLRDGIERLLDEAAAAGVRVAIASTTTMTNIETLLGATLGPTAVGRFAFIGAGDQVKRKKPAPDIYLRVLGELDLPPAACVAIEDSAHGLTAARQADLCTLVTPSYWTQGEDFSAADLVLPSLGSAARPLPPPSAALIGAQQLSLHHLDALQQRRPLGDR